VVKLFTLPKWRKWKIKYGTTIVSDVLKRDATRNYLDLTGEDLYPLTTPLTVKYIIKDYYNQKEVP